MCLRKWADWLELEGSNNAVKMSKDIHHQIAELERNLNALARSRRRVMKQIQKAISDEEKEHLKKVIDGITKLELDCRQAFEKKRKQLKNRQAVQKKSVLPKKKPGDKSVTNIFNHYPRFVQGGTMSKK